MNYGDTVVPPPSKSIVRPASALLTAFMKLLRCRLRPCGPIRLDILPATETLYRLLLFSLTSKTPSRIVTSAAETRGSLATVRFSS